MVFLLKEGRDLVGYEILLANIPGALKTVSSIPEKYRLNIEYIETCSKAKDIYRLFIAIDFTDADEGVTPETILNEYKKAKLYVIDVNIAPSIHNIIFPSRLCVKNIGGMRAILLGLGNMKGLISGIKRNMGPEMGSSFLYHLGYGVGRELYKIYAEPYNIKDIEEGITLLTALARGGGWLDVADKQITDNKIIIKMEQVWECEIPVNEHSEKSKTASNYIRGILAGFFETLLQKRVVVKETSCINRGDRYCEFEITIL